MQAEGWDAKDGPDGEGFFGQLLAVAKKNVIVFFVSAMVVVCQLAAATLTQKVELTLGFNNPFFIIYVSTSCLLFCPVIQLCFFTYQRFRHEESLQAADESFLKSFVRSLEAATTYPLPRLLLYALPLTILWFVANYFFAIALSMTNIASSMSLEQSTTVFVFILSVIFLGEKVNGLKLLAVTICIVGVVYIAIGDQLSATSGAPSPFLGDLLVIVCAVASSTYMTVYTKLLKDLPIALPAVNTLLGCIGLWNFTLLWPGLIVLSFFGVEDYSTLDGEILLFIGLGASFSFLFNYFLNYGMVITSPLFMRIVIVLGVPASFVVNVLLYGFGSFGPSSLLRMVGAAMIIAGFALFTVNSYYMAVRSSYEKLQPGEEEAQLDADRGM